MSNFVVFEGDKYPMFQTEGNASQFAIPFAKHLCQGRGVDVGFSKEEWMFPGAIGADCSDDSNPYHATNLPEDLDYVYSSHCLEHVDDWVGTLLYWVSRLKEGGTLFLYLPHRSQKYWRPWNNRKHLHVLDEEMIRGCLEFADVSHITISSGADLNSSFMVYAVK